MPAYWNNASKNVLLYCLLTVFLLGCKTTTPINNGAIASALSGKAGEPRMFSVSLPDAMDGLLIQAAGSDTVSIDLLDENEDSLGSCVSERVCLIDHPASAKYLIKLTSSADYSNVSISAAWGGETESVLVNNAAEVGISAKQDNVHLKSFYLETAEPLVQVTSTGMSGTLEILDRLGEIQASCGADVCRAGNLSQGLYYVRVTANADFADATLNAQWGAATGVTLQNGMPLEISGDTGDKVTNTLYLPEGADSLMVHNFRRYPVEILDQNDALLQRCTGSNCRVDGLNEGLYRVRIEILSDGFTGHITAAWGGPGVSLIDNGGTAMRPSVPGEASILVPVYLPEGLTRGMAQVNDLTSHVTVFVPMGRGESCIGRQDCAFDVDAPGVYFIRATHHASAPRDMQISAVWGGENVQTLTNGEYQKDLSLQPGEVQLESLYVPDNVFGFVLVPSSHDPLQVDVVSPDSNQRMYCSVYSPCFFWGSRDIPISPGTYMISIMNASDAVLDYDLAIKWIGPGHPSLSNGVNGIETELQPNDFLVDVIVAPEGNNILAAFGSSTNYVDTAVYTLSGSPVDNCMMYGVCVFEGESSFHGGYDFYYVVAVNQSDSPVNASLVATWANESVSTLSSDMSTQRLTLQPRASNLQSVYVPGDLSNMDVFVGANSPEARVIAEVYDFSGLLLASCDSYESCVFPARVLNRRELIVSFTSDAGQAVTFNPVVSLASPDYATFNNGEFKRDIVLEPNELRVEAIYSPLELWDLRASGFAVSDLGGNIDVGLHNRSGGEYLVSRDTGSMLPDAGAQFISLYNAGYEPQVFSLSAAWATQMTGSLTEGATFSDLSGQQGDTMLQTFVPAESGTATVTTSNPDVVVSLGTRLESDEISCQSVCNLEVTAGLPYFFKTRFMDNAENVTVTVTW